MKSLFVQEDMVPNVQCLTCGQNIALEVYSYHNYQGPVICPSCRSSQQVVIAEGMLKAANRALNIFDTVGDIVEIQWPAPVFADLVEAASAFNVNAYKACVVMCRRALQGILLERGVEDGSLANMIAAAKGTPGLPADLYESASAVRVFGNSGAHPRDEALQSVDRMRAMLAMEVVKDIIKRVYPPVPRPPAPPLGTSSNEASPS
jgi:hypothetical protein